VVGCTIIFRRRNHRRIVDSFSFAFSPSEVAAGPLTVGSAPS